MKHNVLLLEYVSEEAHRILSQQTNLLEAATPFSGQEIAEKHPIHAIVTRGKGDVSKELISKCPDLKIIARCGVGLDNIEVDFATQKGIKVVNAPGSNADTVAEHTMGLMLMLQRNLYHGVAAVKKDNWDFRLSYEGDEIRGKTLGILGLGDIGSKVAALATAFGMKIIYWGKEEKKDCAYSFRSFEQVLKESDILSFHLPLVEGTRNLIDEKAFQKMQPHTLIINTSRGAIIDQNALYHALENKKIGGFAADVLANEPPKEKDSLLQLPNVLITPHSASLTATTFNEMCVITVQNTIEFLQGKNINEKYIFNKAQL